jgi:hypothetical protein
MPLAIEDCAIIGRERLARYLARPAIASERLSLAPDGRVGGARAPAGRERGVREPPRGVPGSAGGLGSRCLPELEFAGQEPLDPILGTEPNEAGRVRSGHGRTAAGGASGSIQRVAGRVFHSRR